MRTVQKGGAFMQQALEKLIRQAADIMLTQQSAAVHTKEGHYNFVTDADIAVQALLQEGLLKLLPGSILLAEEKENQPLGNEPTWIVDPIDGTINFMRGRRYSAVSVALVRQGQAVLGMIYDPYSDEMFWAEAGKGCFLNGQQVQVSQIPMQRALVTFGTTPYQPELAKKGMQAAYAILKQAGDLRRSGTSSLDFAWVACGRSECFFEMSLSPWDYAAGILLVREAGGLVTQPLEPVFDHGKAACVLASNQLCFDTVLGAIMAAAEGRLDNL
jgi:myo-inositol-1(or 4)-monophosphatase